MDYSENTLTTDVAAVSSQYSRIIDHSGLVKLDALAVPGACKRYIIRVEIVKARSTQYFIWLIAQYIENGRGCEKDVRVGFDI